MSDCARIRGRCDVFLDGELPPDQAAEVRAHVERCDQCRRVFEGQRALLDLVAAEGREIAPPELRRRVEAVLESGGGAVPGAGPGRRTWGLLAAAAVVALLLVARPWSGPADRPEAPASAAGLAFAADHRAHAERAPSGAPFPPGAAPAPPLPGGELSGVSRCVVGGRAYAHFTYREGDATYSVFIPLDEAPPPDARGAGDLAVVAFDAGAGRPAAVLVSDGLAEPALRRIWLGG